MPDGGDVEELEGTLEGEVDGEHDDEAPSAATYLRTGEDYLGQLEEQAKQTGRSTGLGGLRKAVKKTRDLVEQAERAGYERARAELRAEALDDATREQLKAEYVAELRGQDAARRNALRLGVPDALLGNFEGLGSDFKDWERRAAELHAQNITWGDSPLVQRVAAAQVQAYRQQAEQQLQNGTLDLRPGVTPEDIIAKAVGQQQAAQAGGTPVSAAPTLQQEIEEAARNPAALGEDGALALAERFNRELDGLAQARRQGW